MDDVADVEFEGELSRRSRPRELAPLDFGVGTFYLHAMVLALLYLVGSRFAVANRQTMRNWLEIQQNCSYSNFYFTLTKLPVDANVEFAIDWERLDEYSNVSTDVLINLSISYFPSANNKSLFKQTTYPVRAASRSRFSDKLVFYSDQVGTYDEILANASFLLHNLD